MNPHKDSLTNVGQDRSNVGHNICLLERKHLRTILKTPPYLWGWSYIIFCIYEVPYPCTSYIAPHVPTQSRLWYNDISPFSQIYLLLAGAEVLPGGSTDNTLLQKQEFLFTPYTSWKSQDTVPEKKKQNCTIA